MDSLVHKKFSLAREEVELRRDEDIDQIRCELGARGNLNSGAAVKLQFEIYEKCANEIVDL